MFLPSSKMFVNCYLSDFVFCFYRILCFGQDSENTHLIWDFILSKISLDFKICI